MKPMKMISTLSWLEMISVAYTVPYFLLPLHNFNKVLDLGALFSAPFHNQSQYLSGTKPNSIKQKNKLRGL
jgi:hypothetical protein